MPTIGETVKVHYTGKYLDGKVFDTTVASEPIVFTIGDDMMIPGFEKAIKTMSPGQHKSVVIKSEDAYGPYDPELLVEVNRKEVFGDKPLKVGDSIQAPTDDGIMFFKVHEVKENTVIMDGNAEMAGHDVIFDIELIEVMNVMDSIFDSDEFTEVYEEDEEDEFDMEKDPFDDDFDEDESFDDGEESYEEEKY
jgi:FKBP-type peptidyl-prolyl cis-trans isomerase 2